MAARIVRAAIRPGGETERAGSGTERRASVLTDGCASLGVQTDRVRVGAELLARVVPDQPFVDADAKPGLGDPKGVVLRGGCIAPSGIAPELRLKMLEASLGLRLIDDFDVGPGDQVVPRTPVSVGRPDLRGGGP